MLVFPETNWSILLPSPFRPPKPRPHQCEFINLTFGINLCGKDLFLFVKINTGVAYFFTTIILLATASVTQVIIHNSYLSEK